METAKGWQQTGDSVPLPFVGSHVRIFKAPDRYCDALVTGYKPKLKSSRGTSGPVWKVVYPSDDGDRSGDNIIFLDRTAMSMVVDLLIDQTTSLHVDEFKMFIASTGIGSDVLATDDNNKQQQQLASISNRMSIPSKSPRNEPSPAMHTPPQDPSTSRSSPISSNDTEVNRVWKAPRGERLEEIRASIMHGVKYVDVAANSPPIPFKTDIFDGYAVLHINSGNSNFIGFAGKGSKYRFEVQAQGRFLKKPSGPMFFGAEITKKMELGLLTRAMCSSIMQVGHAINPLMHHSYGDKHDMELPHIVGPFWSLLDRLVITKPGETPPVLGVDKFDEPDLELKHKRKKDPSFVMDIDLDCTYSFSFKTSNIDLLQWNISNLSFVSGTDLHTFWSDADIRLVAYYIPKDTNSLPLPPDTPPEKSPKIQFSSNGMANVHPQVRNVYMFAMQIKHVSNNASNWPPFLLAREDITPKASANKRKSVNDKNNRSSGKSKSNTHSRIYADGDVGDDENGRLSPTEIANRTHRGRSVADLVTYEHVTRIQKNKKSSSHGNSSSSSEVSSDDDDDENLSGAENEKDEEDGDGSSWGYEKDCGSSGNEEEDDDDDDSDEDAFYDTEEGSLLVPSATSTASFSGATERGGGETVSSDQVLVFVDEDFPFSIVSPPPKTARQEQQQQQQQKKKKTIGNVDSTAAVNRRRPDVAAIVPPPYATPPPNNTRKIGAVDAILDERCTSPFNDTPTNIGIGDGQHGATTLNITPTSTTMQTGGITPILIDNYFAVPDNNNAGDSAVSASAANSASASTAPPGGAGCLPAAEKVNCFSSSHKGIMNNNNSNNINTPPLVRCALEVDDSRASHRQQRRRCLYAFAVVSTSYFFSDSSSSTGTPPAVTSYVLHSFKEFEAVLPLLPEKHLLKDASGVFSRCGSVERRRRRLDASYRAVIEQSAANPALRAKLNLFISNGSHTGAFLREDVGGGVSKKKLRAGLAPFIMESIVAVKNSNHFWLEECMGLTEDELVFIMPPQTFGSLVRLVVPLKDILYAKHLDRSQHCLGLTDIFSFAVCTFSRQYVILIRGKDACDIWVQTIEEQKGGGAPAATGKVAAAVGGGGAAAAARESSKKQKQQTGHLELVVRPDDWKLGERVILNARQYTRYCTSTSASTSTIGKGPRTNPTMKMELLSPISQDLAELTRRPALLVAHLLEIVLKICDLVAKSDSDSTTMLLDGIESVAGSTRFNSSSSSISSSINTGTKSSSGDKVSGCQPSSWSKLSIGNLWVRFMDGVSLLQNIDILSTTTTTTGMTNTNTTTTTDRTADWTADSSSSSSSSSSSCTSIANSENHISNAKSAERLCMFLNLYHCMLLHSFLIVGLPNTLSKWSSFFRMCSYEAFGDIFSLAELEHNIIRAGMHKPDVGMLGKVFLPTSQYSFSCNYQDYRLCTAINCGSLSLTGTIPVFNPHTLEQQLNFVFSANLVLPIRLQGGSAASATASSTFTGDGGDATAAAAAENSVLTITLPQFVQWFARDFEYFDSVGMTSYGGGTGAGAAVGGARINSRSVSSDHASDAGALAVAATPASTSTSSSITQTRHILNILVSHMDRDPQMRLQASRIQAILSTGRDSYIVLKYDSFVFKSRYLRKVDDVELMMKSF